MPFTVSHVAAVLPPARRLLRHGALSAAIIGSMVPDFGVLMPWRPPRFETHGVTALFTFCLPVGLATFWLFQRVVKTPLLELLPDAAYLRSRPWAAPCDWRRLSDWLRAAGGVLLGAVTHLVWDAFTHEGARGLRMFPSLEDPAVDFAGHHVVGARLMQDLSSLVGLGVVLAVSAFALRSRGSQDGDPPPRRLAERERYRWTLAYVVVATGVTGFFCALHLHDLSPIHSFGARLGTVAIAALRGAALALIGVSAGLGAVIAPRAD